MQARRLLAMILCVGIAGTPLRADDASESAPAATLPPGQRIRFTTATIGPRQATVMETDGEALVLHLLNLDGTDRVVRVPLAEVRSLEIAAGQRTRAGEGAIIGFIPGALAGWSIGHYLPWCLDAEGQPCDPSTLIALITVVSGLVGALIGGSLGGTIKTDRWQKVGIPQATVQLAPAKGGGLAVGLTLSF
jgi:hypothetical protein